MLDQISAIVGKENILTNEPMAKHTSFHIGGPARYFVTIQKEAELTAVLCLLMETQTPYYLLGNGSNLLVGDGGYDGVILHLAGDFLRITSGDAETSDDSSVSECLTVGAGVMLSKAAYTAMEQGLTGLEFASGIPGTVGGAIAMNAGAYDGEMRLVVESVRLLCRKMPSDAVDDTKDRASADYTVVKKSNAEMAFGYRTSILKSEEYQDAIVLSVTLRLAQGEKEAIKAKMNEFTKLRQSKQPLEYPSAGSTFKRPEGHFAGKLIADAGLRGYQVGDAQVSEKHCGFVINRGNATAAEVRSLMAHVEETVYAQTGVDLEPEVLFVGKFN